MSSLTKRKNRYYYRYRDLSGKQHFVSLNTADKDKAIQRKEEYDYQLQLHGDIKKFSLLFRDIFLQYKSEVVSQKSITRQRELAYQFNAMGELHGKKIISITKENVLKIVESDFSYSYRSKLLLLIRNLIKFSMERGWLLHDCTINIRLRNEDAGIRSRSDFLTIDDLKRVLIYARKHYPDYAPMFELAYYTGMRLGEVRQIEWSDIDFDAKRILLPIFKVKTRRSQHVVLNTKAIEVLNRIEHTGDFVFPSPVTGRPYSDKHPARVVRKILKALKLYTRGITGHIFRKSFISHLIQNGAKPKEVQELARHKDIRTTMNVYARLSPDYLKDAIEKLPSLDI